MHDEPRPSEILAAVAAFLRGVVAGQATPLVAFQARVAANAVELCARQIAASDTSEVERLRALVGRDGTLAELNAELAACLADGRLDGHDPTVAAHLRTTTLAKLAVDQPRYAGYLAALDKEP